VASALSEGVEERVFRAMRAAWDRGEPWSSAPQAGPRKAVRRMVEDFGFKAPDAASKLKGWDHLKIIQMDVCNSDTKVKGYRVKDGFGQIVLSTPDIFG
jgi:hypothetical protein